MVNKHITALSSVALSQKVGDKTEKGRSSVYVEVMMKYKQMIIQTGYKLLLILQVAQDFKIAYC